MSFLSTRKIYHEKHSPFRCSVLDLVISVMMEVGIERRFYHLLYFPTSNVELKIENRC